MALSKKGKGRIIFHIDMNSFYASVETSYNPKLKGKPLAIAGNPEKRKGVIVTSSYEARAKGVRTTMNVWQAKKLCPELIVMPPNFDRYRKASKEMFRILAEITPCIQPISIDEGYMDITDSPYHEKPLETAHYLQQKILDTLGLPSSIGIAPNKFLAKTASDMEKPLGITVLRKREVPEILWPLQAGEMHGIGEKTAEKLNANGIYTIGDLAVKDVYELKQLLGVNGERLKNRANGIDTSAVNPDAIYDFKSIGSSQTLEADTVNEKEIYHHLKELADNVERRLKRKEAAGKSVQITIRYHDRKTITRSKKLEVYIDEQAKILQIADELFQKHWNEEPIRLLGITVQDVDEKRNIGTQLDLFSYENAAKQENLSAAIDTLSKKYGKNPFVQWEKKEENKHIEPRTSFQKDFLDDYK